jgi:two-component system, LuxR family, response regulator FixJ
MIGVENRDRTSVAVIEDDERMREALVFQLSTAGFPAEAYASAESFLNARGLDDVDCVVADICLPRMNGLELLEEVRRSAPFVSFVFVTGRGDMSIGVQAMREGAVDCLAKPLNDEALLNAVGRGIELSRIRRADRLRVLDLEKREKTLTPREHEVFALITSGMLNKQAGAKLGSTERTVKAHRARVMAKMGADSLADLVRMAEILRVQNVG